jgi:pimeloyl-ACP methyl ester carboxylesterase
VIDVPFAQLADIKLYYELDGKGDDLLLIHGVTSYIGNWRFVRPELNGHFRLILPDLRGHGQSDKPLTHYSIEMFAQDLIQLLDELNIDKCIVAGHSLGGFISQQIALDAPDRVRALVLICTAPRVDVEAAMAQIEVTQQLHGLPPDQVIEKQMELYYENPDVLRATPGMFETLKKDINQSQENLVSHGYAQGATLSFNTEERLGEIQAPTLVIQCAQDKTFPMRWGEFLRDQIPNAELRVINKTSHSIQMEQPRPLAQTIIEFCKAL